MELQMQHRLKVIIYICLNQPNTHFSCINSKTLYQIIKSYILVYFSTIPTLVINIKYTYILHCQRSVNETNG